MGQTKKQTHPSLSRLRKVGMYCLWVVLIPILLFLLAVFLLYLPPVQQWAVNKACKVLSEETGMDVKVESVRLSFPLDLAMGGMTAVQDADTVASATQLNVSVKLLPFFEGRAEVDDASLYGTRLNTKQLIDACEIKGFIDRVSLDSHSTDLIAEKAIVNKLLVSDADLCIVLNDSVPDDTTESEPVRWKVQLDDIQLKNIKATVVLPDSSRYGANIASTSAKAFLDLGKSEYKAELKAQDADFKIFKDFNDLNSLQIPRINSLSAVVTMDSLALNLKSLKAQTDCSRLALAFRMDMNAFDSINPGRFTAIAEGSVGKADITRFVQIDIQPELPSTFKVRAEGNLEILTVSDLNVVVPGLVTLDGDVTVLDATTNLALSTNLAAHLVGNGEVEARADVSLRDEAYNAAVKFSNVNVSKLAALPAAVVLTGNIDAHGRGFDMQKATASVSFDKACYGQVDLSNTTAIAEVNSGIVNLNITCDNQQVNTAFAFDGELTKQHVGGKLNIDLQHLDLCAMGLRPNPLAISTDGWVEFDYDLDRVFKVEAEVRPTELTFAHPNNPDESVHFTTRSFHLAAESLPRSSSVCFTAGDMDLDFSTPNNLFALPPQVNRLMQAAMKQAKNKDFNINELKQFFPQFNLHINAAKGNPLTQYLRAYGVSFDEFLADVNSSPESGIDANCSVSNLCKDSIRIDHAELMLQQDTTVLEYRILASRFDDKPLPSFYATLEGYLGSKVADMHLVAHNMNGEKGYDIGLHAIGTDTCHHITLYPEQPTLAFQQYQLNDSSFVCRPRSGDLVLGNVKMRSLTDKSSIVLKAKKNDSGEQYAFVEIADIDVAKMLKSLPLMDMPQAEGLLSGYAEYSVENEQFTVGGRVRIADFVYEGMDVGRMGLRYSYTPVGETAHNVNLSMACDSIQVGDLSGIYDAAGKGTLAADANIYNVPLDKLSPFIPDQMAQLTGSLTGHINVAGPTDRLLLNGKLAPRDVHVLAPQYSIDLALANDSITLTNSRMTFDKYHIYGYDDNPLALNGFVDFSNTDKMDVSLNLSGNNFKLVESKRASKKVLFGNMFGDVNVRVQGTTNDLSVRGRVKVLKSSDMTYIMSETPLSQGDRLDDIVTFVDFKAPQDTTVVEEKKTFMGLSMNMNLVVEDGARVRAELSPDRQSYVDVQGGGTLRMTITPEGVMSMNGRYTINEGEMKYSLPVIPLRTFTIHNGSYIEFTGDMMNPSMNITATERTRAAVSESDGSSRSVTFDAGVRLSNTLENMGLEFIIEAPDDQAVQSELESLGAEERNKLAVAMLATNMYLAAGNGKNLNATNALNTFLQSEINNIAGKALNSLVNVDVGMEQNTSADGATRTDYSFKFSRRFFSDRLNVIIGGKVSGDGDGDTGQSGTYIDDISLEWRLDDGGTQYVRIFHEKDHTNIIEGELDQNGAGIVLRKKVEKLSDLFLWRRKKEE